MTFFLWTWWTQQKTSEQKLVALHLGLQDDSPHIAFGSRHHLREEALNKRRMVAMRFLSCSHVAMVAMKCYGSKWNAIRLDDIYIYIYYYIIIYICILEIYMSEILWMIPWMIVDDVRAWYRNVLMVGFHFAVWLLAFTPVSWHHRAHGQLSPCESFEVGGNVKDTQCGFKLFKANAPQARLLLKSMAWFRLQSVGECQWRCVISTETATISSQCWQCCQVGKQIFASLHLYRWAFDIEVPSDIGSFPVVRLLPPRKDPDANEHDCWFMLILIHISHHFSISHRSSQKTLQPFFDVFHVWIQWFLCWFLCWAQVLILGSIFGKGVAEVPVTWVEMPGSKLNLLTGAVTMLRDMALVQAAARAARAARVARVARAIFGINHR